MPTSKWPKLLPPLTPEQRRISDDFMKHWLEVLPKRFGVVERFNHDFLTQNSSADFRTTLEIGAGLGEHLYCDALNSEQERNYHAIEIRENIAEKLRQNFPNIQTVVGDCQSRLGFSDGYFDRVLAVHLLEHLPNLPGCVREVYRLCRKPDGRFLVVIPCEGGLAYTLARKISAERIYKRRYGGSYKWFYSREHINLPDEIFAELRPYFTIANRVFFPLPFIPFTFCNLFIGILLRPRPTPLPI